MSRKKSKSEKLPGINTPLRAAIIMNITDFNDYKEKVKKGFPLFSQDELQDVQNRYVDGLTWDEIEKELFRKNIILKKATFRKYIQENNLPKAKTYRNVGKRRLAVFPKDVISHINFLHYFYKAADITTIDFLFNIFSIANEYKMTYLEAIESKLSYSDYLYPSVLRYIGWDDGEAYDAIEETLSNRPEDQKKALNMLEEIDNKFRQIIDKEIQKLISFLKKNHINPSEVPNSDE